MKKLFFDKKVKLLSEKYEGLRFSLYTASFLILTILLVEMVLLLYWSMFTFYVESEVKTDSLTVQPAVQITPQRLRNNYLSQIKEVSRDLSQISIDVSTYQALKDKLLLLSVPREYLDFHFRLVVAVDKLLDYMILQVNNPSREHEQLVSSQAAYINEYLTTIDHVSDDARE